MARRSARSDRPQSNTTLIVFLVISILLNLALGVFFYMSQSKIDQAQKTASDAKNAQTGAEQQRDAATNYYIPLLMRVIGDKSTPDQTIKDQSSLAGRLNQTWLTGTTWQQLMGSANNPGGLIGPPDASGIPSI